MYTLNAQVFGFSENSWNFKVIKVCIFALKRVPSLATQVYHKQRNSHKHNQPNNASCRQTRNAFILQKTVTFLIMDNLWTTQ
jgi:hypothetical protein